MGVLGLLVRRLLIGALVLLKPLISHQSLRKTLLPLHFAAHCLLLTCTDHNSHSKPHSVSCCLLAQITTTLTQYSTWSECVQAWLKMRQPAERGCRSQGWARSRLQQACKLWPLPLRRPGPRQLSSRAAAHSGGRCCCAARPLRPSLLKSPRPSHWP